MVQPLHLVSHQAGDAPGGGPAGPVLLLLLRGGRQHGPVPERRELLRAVRPVQQPAPGAPQADAGRDPTGLRGGRLHAQAAGGDGKTLNMMN